MSIRTKAGSGNSNHCVRDDHDLYKEVLNARMDADEKHGINSIEGISWDFPGWLTILVEEVGEVAHALTYDADEADVRAELIDVLAVASAWIDAMDRAQERIERLRNP